jgi:hypothetical protein
MGSVCRGLCGAVIGAAARLVMFLVPWLMDGDGVVRFSVVSDVIDVVADE